MTRLVLSLAATLIALVDANVLPTKTLLMLHGSGQTSSAFLISPTKRGAKHFLSGMPWPNRFKLNWKYKAIDAGNAEGSWMEDVDASVAAIEMAIEEEGISGLVGFEEGGTVAAVVAARKATRLKFAVICAAAMPTDASHTALLNQLRDSPDATIPTLHCLSKADSMSAQGEALAACFAPGGELLWHEGGAAMPPRDWWSLSGAFPERAWLQATGPSPSPSPSPPPSPSSPSLSPSPSPSLSSLPPSAVPAASSRPPPSAAPPPLSSPPASLHLDRGRRSSPLVMMSSSSEMDWRKQLTNDPTARGVREASGETRGETTHQRLAAAARRRREAEMASAKGVGEVALDEQAVRAARERAVKRLEAALRRVEPSMPDSSAAALLSALGEAYTAGVEPASELMRETAAQIAALECDQPSANGGMGAALRLSGGSSGGGGGGGGAADTGAGAVGRSGSGGADAMSLSRRADTMARQALSGLRLEHPHKVLRLWLTLTPTPPHPDPNPSPKHTTPVHNPGPKRNPSPQPQSTTMAPNTTPVHNHGPKHIPSPQPWPQTQPQSTTMAPWPRWTTSGSRATVHSPPRPQCIRSFTAVTTGTAACTATGASFGYFAAALRLSTKRR